MTAFDRILVATDFEDPSRQPLDVGIELARPFGSSITLAHVWDVPPYPYGTDAEPISKAVGRVALVSGGRDRRGDRANDVMREASRDTIRHGSTIPAPDGVTRSDSDEGSTSTSASTSRTTR
jgi:nucleotide-binding universal stress UspA family protein